MSLRFSRVTAVAAHKTAVFLVGGIPACQRDLDSWTAFRYFAEDLPVNEIISVFVETFEYDREESFDATPEETAYINMREECGPGFIEARTKKTDESGFLLSLSKQVSIYN